MARAPRPKLPGGFHHVTTRGNRHQTVYFDDFDRRQFTALLTTVVEALDWRCHGFCLMPNHYHLVLETPEANLSAGMQRLNGVYAKTFNWIHGFEGHLFERRFRCVVVERDSHLLELARYLALNPVRAGLCDHPREWLWSSYRALVGLAAPPDFLTCDWLLSQFGPDARLAQTRFADFVDGRAVAA